jgi:hypothetical protein
MLIYLAFAVGILTVLISGYVTSVTDPEDPIIVI